MNIFQWKPLDLELKILEILENIASLRPRSSTMPASLEMFRHAIIIYSASCIHFRGLYATRTAARGPKSREKVHLKSVLTDLAMCTGLPFDDRRLRYNLQHELCKMVLLLEYR